MTGIVCLVAVLLLFFSFRSDVAGDTVSVEWSELEKNLPQARRVRPFSPCPCDLKALHCDASCCCDLDCKAEQLAGICKSKEALKSGLSTPLDCDSENTFSSRFSSTAFCVLKNNNPFLGNVFSFRKTLQTQIDFRSLATLNNLPKDGHQTYSKDNKRASEYTNGANIQIAFEKYDSIVYKLFKLRQAWIGSHCSDLPLKYLQEAKVKCYERITAKNCESNESFNILKYALANTNEEDQLRFEHLPLLVSTLSDKSTLLASIRVSRHHDIFYKLKLNFYKQPSPAASQILFAWYALNSKGTVNNSSFLPRYDEQKEVCHNVVTGVEYLFIWEGQNVLGLDINVELATVPVSLPASVVKSVVSGGRVKRGKIEIGIMQHFHVIYEHWDDIERASGNSSDVPGGNFSNNINDLNSSVIDYTNDTSSDLITTTMNVSTNLLEDLETINSSKNNENITKVRRQTMVRSDSGSNELPGSGSSSSLNFSIDSSISWYEKKLNINDSGYDNSSNFSNNSLNIFSFETNFTISATNNETYDDYSAVNSTEETFTTDNSIDDPSDNSSSNLNLYPEFTTPKSTTQHLPNSNTNSSEEKDFNNEGELHGRSAEVYSRRGYTFGAKIEGVYESQWSKTNFTDESNLTAAGFFVFELPSATQHHDRPWLCSAAQRTSVTFGTNVASGCALRVTTSDNSSDACQNIRAVAYEALLSNAHATHVSSFGDLNARAEFIPLLGLEDVMGPDVAATSTPPEPLPGVCRAPVRLVFSFWHACSVRHDGRCQAHGLVAARVQSVAILMTN
ncbi:uncharacterized protein LOC125178546 [Hyalella azteca]|uniref:Uncharacterized protein LOC125178546 n=1 Tax=Hyalella azteca TaxID=294128 RepID=A0A979FPY3_HYAAZ|nr:uncharacterized protein LOC125178546 [Hyalella azteca]